MDVCDVAIVGGGPAGSACARALVSRGLATMVLDQQNFPRDKVCAGWITPQVVAALELSLDDYSRGRVLQPISAFAVGVLGGQAVDVTYGKTVSYAIRRCEFDDYLLRRCAAPLRLGAPVRDIRFEKGYWLIDDVCRAKFLVGAGGHFCPVARRLGADVGRGESAVYAQEIEFAMTEEESRRCQTREAQPELYFCRDLLGYGWCVRKGDYLNVGLGRETNRGLAEELRTFWAWLHDIGRVPSASPPHFKGHAYLLNRRRQRVRTGENVLLIGDSAGMAYDHSGEGIRPAIESGLMAADAIANAIRDNRSSGLYQYERQLDARFGRRKNYALSRATRSPATPIPSALRQSIGRYCLGNRSFVRQIVLDRWFLHRHQPAMRRQSASETAPVFPAAAGF